MPQRAGWEAQLRYKTGGSATVLTFAFRRLIVNGEVQPLDVSNSEGKPGRPGAANARGFAGRVKNLRSAEVTMEQATFDDDSLPWSASNGLVEGNYIDELTVYPAGVASPASARVFSGLLITRSTYNAEVGGAQPFSVVAMSDGQFT